MRRSQGQQPDAAGEVPPPSPDDVLAATLRCTWALTTWDQFFVPETSREILSRLG